ncbi:MAG: preprotein translocase subunit SecE [Cyanobacteria bacterium SID2]|nr:preprotein translocase subunit SecE [Cyanobacteria bacterium SID2]MBP0006090.1 preprotein translocase subunit SecE [Cyanobacteria bacterium SBC]
MAKKNETNAQETSQGFNPLKFLQETKEELSKVVWPSRQQVISESAAVLLMVMLLASAIYLVDNLFGWAAKQIFG